MIYTSGWILIDRFGRPYSFHYSLSDPILSVLSGVIFSNLAG